MANINNGDVLNDGTLKWKVRKPVIKEDVGYRDSIKEYTLGQIAYSTQLPLGWFLECTTAGATSNGNLTITEPELGDTITDGTVTWTIRSFAKILSFDKTTGTLNLATAYIPPVQEIDYSSLPYLSFIEENSESFTLKTNNTSKNWDGTLEYSTDTENWSTWDGTEISSSNDGKLYLRGINNTSITGSSDNAFVLTSGKRIQCIGNIENLLDYQNVQEGNYTNIDDGVFSYLFEGNSSLVSAPSLPRTSFVGCLAVYRGMFKNCTSLMEAPALPATVIDDGFYSGMFEGCTSLTKAPDLPATTLGRNCYYQMFYNCTSLTGTIHCPASTSSDANKLVEGTDYPSNTITVVYDL